MRVDGSSLVVHPVVGAETVDEWTVAVHGVEGVRLLVIVSIRHVIRADTLVEQRGEVAGGELERVRAGWKSYQKGGGLDAPVGEVPASPADCRIGALAAISEVLSELCP